jgi:hypothetical protein
MLRLAVAAFAAFQLMTFSALASQCPSMAAAIDAALANADVTEEVRVQVIELRDQGMAAHEAGNHAESEATLAEAQALLAN